MKRYFADSFYYFALGSVGDSAHAAASAFHSTNSAQLVTTDWVLTELADGWIRPHQRSLAVRTIDWLLDDPGVLVVPCSRELLRAGLDLFRRRPDKEWSLTDCISFIVMEREKLTEALTGDHHFEQAGFTALLRE